MKTSTYLFFLFLINVLIGASILNNGANILVIQHALPFIPGWMFALIGWGFVVSSLLCLATRLIWSPFAQRFLGAHLIRWARILSLTLSLCSVAPWTMVVVLETVFLHSAALGAVIYLAMVWVEWKELKWPDLTPEMEYRALAAFKRTTDKSRG